MKHLAELRSADSTSAPIAPAELAAELAAGVNDELIAVFPARSRSALPSLTAGIAFSASDSNGASPPTDG